MSKLGSETKDNISPVSTSISNDPPPVALNVDKALFNSSSITYCKFVSNVNCNG